MFMKRFFRGGANVPHRKKTAQSPTIPMPVPEKVVIPLLQHIGAICEPTVKKGDLVKVGQVIGNSEKALVAPIHSSVSGTVTAVDFMLWAGGTPVTCVEIQTDGLQDVHESVKPPVYSNKAEFLRAIRESGLVGLGGAGFPAHVKLAPPQDKPIDTLVVNAAECEPYITSDYREILENSWNVLSGIKLVLHNLGIKKAIVGIEDNKPDAIAELKKIVSSVPGVSLAVLPTRYPQGAEKMLIWATTKRKVPIGKLPADVGVIVMNVTSISFLAQYFKTGMPLVKKKVTVDGSCVRAPMNAEVLIGTSLKDVFEFAQGLKETPHKVVMGGPMMGVAQHSLETQVVKQTNALLAFSRAESETPKQGPCIRCTRCVRACPMALLPLEIHRSSLKGNVAALESLSVAACIECGSCSFACPAHIPLVQTIRLAKTQVKIAAIKKGASS